MKKIILAIAAVVAVSGCTTTERDVATGAAIGAATGGAVSGNASGAAVGAAAGAAGGLLVRNLRNGYCQYRNPRTGHIYTARC
ncbi:lipoprotein [Aminobacter sp. HY435]|uniref:lipoprotein n=1 Tax=Aminobacter sp. HY435 TaxID=2970917 RepID=UPI0022B9B532|nr:lipoprotein [Aminobacter sp. HY435]